MPRQLLTAEKPAHEAGNRQDGNMHLLTHYQVVLADCVVVAPPDRVGIVADIAKVAGLVAVNLANSVEGGLT